VGIDYGSNGDNLPTPQKAVQLLQKLGITQVRIYDTNPTILQAFSSSSTSNNISVAVGVPNDLLLTLGESPAAATQWVTSTIVPAMAAMANITAIAVGSETLTKDITLWPVLVPAMTNIHAALTANLLDSKIKVSSPCSTDLLMSTFPPSNGAFNSTFVVPVILPLLQFLSRTNSFFMLNVNTFHIFQQNSQSLTLDYALFRPNPGVMDSTSGLRYFNLFDAVVDSVFYAIAALNHSELPLVVTSTGWPTQGDPNEVGASVSNAQVYNGNLVKRVLTNVGTPAKPSSVINTYLNGLFDEDKNVGPVSERSWGLFNADQTPKYAVDLVGQGVPDISGFNGTPVYKTWCVAKQVCMCVAIKSRLTKKNCHDDS
jgi:exo-beta-1,3-glucanase (GH17 family)